MLTPYPYQREAIDSIFSYFARGNRGNPVICMPTGSGKSAVIAVFIKETMAKWPATRFLIATHRKELLVSNSEELLGIWPSAPVGLYSAGLNQKVTHKPIIFGGIQSIAHNVEAFGHRDLLIVDEAHLLGPKADTQYQETISKLKKINPYLKVIGLTATPYRLGQGKLIDGENPIFTDICYDITGVAAFNQLIADGYLAPLRSKGTTTQIDISGVGRGADGDYAKGELEEALDKPTVNHAACAELVQYGQDRRAWMVFCAGIKHAEHVAEILRNMCIQARAIHSKLEESEVDYLFSEYRSGKLRCIVGADKFTTGFNYRPVDYIGMLRPTQSTGLWVQMLGRGTRPSPETNKSECLVLDFTKNTENLGPINDPKIPEVRIKGQKDKPGIPLAKICPNCGTYNSPNSSECAYCHHAFPAREMKIEGEASTLSLLADTPTNPDIIEWFDVDRVSYQRMFGNNRQYLRVGYSCGARQFYENVFLEGSNKLKAKAEAWWKRRMNVETVPPTIFEALKYTNLLATPKRIQVNLSHKFNDRLDPKILNYEGLVRETPPDDARPWWDNTTQLNCKRCGSKYETNHPYCLYCGANPVTGA